MQPAKHDTTKLILWAPLRTGLSAVRLRDKTQKRGGGVAKRGVARGANVPLGARLLTPPLRVLFYGILRTLTPSSRDPCRAACWITRLPASLRAPRR